jgi:predicted nucleic-acid-binding Zn-ribbon protein
MEENIQFDKTEIRVWEEWTCSKCDETNYSERSDAEQPLSHRHCEQCGFTEYFDSTELF